MAEPARSIPIEPDALLAKLHPLRAAAVTPEALAADALLAAALGLLLAAALAWLVGGPLAARRRDPLRAARALPPPERVAACLGAVRDAAGGPSWVEAFAARTGRPAPEALLAARARLYAGEGEPDAAEAEAVERAARAALAALRRAGPGPAPRGPFSGARRAA